MMDSISFSLLLELFILVLPRSESCKIRSKMEAGTQDAGRLSQGIAPIEVS